jgi:acetyl esterase/lipase
MSTWTIVFIVLVVLVLLFAALWYGIYFAFRGPDLSQYDLPPGDRGGVRATPSPENEVALVRLREMQSGVVSRSFHERIAQMRASLDGGVPGTRQTAEELGVTIREVDAGGVPAEWVLAEGADPGRRLLYLHGGAFAAGSPRSHRAITARFARRTRASVLVIDYRLLPEHPRIAGIEDCQRSYEWLLDHGPDGPRAADDIFVAGDSAGGNLTLMLIAWIRDQGLRQVNAAIAIGPAVDGTSSSPSMRDNVPTDAMIGHTVGRLTTLPPTLIYLFTLVSARMRPTDPRISPIFGDLSNLPPTLIQVSDAEILRDDGRRWVNKARSQGTDARLQWWPGMIHVWHAFADILPEAEEAFDRIEEFISEHSAARVDRISVGQPA